MTGQGGLGRASVLLASGTMVSRVLGFVKTAVLAAAIGQSASRAADSFALANQLPNNIYALIAGGLLSDAVDAVVLARAAGAGRLSRGRAPAVVVAAALAAAQQAAGLTRRPLPTRPLLRR